MVIKMVVEEKVEKNEEKYEAIEHTEVKELEAVKVMVSEWLDKISVIAKEIIGAITSSLDGKKLGEEITEMYKRLKESGLPDDTINEIIRDFYKKKLELAPRLSDLISIISERFLPKKVEKEVITKEKTGAEGKKE